MVPSNGKEINLRNKMWNRRSWTQDSLYTKYKIFYAVGIEIRLLDIFGEGQSLEESMVLKNLFHPKILLEMILPKIK